MNEPFLLPLEGGGVLSVSGDGLEQLAVRLEEIRAARGEPSVRRWMNVPEIAAHLGWPEKRIYNFGDRIPRRKVGNRLMYDPVEVDAWLESSGG